MIKIATEQRDEAKVSQRGSDITKTPNKRKKATKLKLSTISQLHSNKIFTNILQDKNLE